MKKKYISPFARKALNLMAGAALLFWANAITSCDTTGNGSEEPTPEPIGKVETHNIKEIWLDDGLPGYEKIKIGYTDKSTMSSYLKADKGEHRFEFTGEMDLEPNNIRQGTYGFNIDFTKSDTLKLYDANSAELLTLFVTVPSKDVDDPNRGWTFSNKFSPEEARLFVANISKSRYAPQ